MEGWREGGLKSWLDSWGWVDWLEGLEGWRAGGLEARRAGRSTISELAQNL